MIELKKGDILKADAEALVNTVNCVGIMGRGIALQFRKAFPENYKEYQKICANKALKPGQILFHDLNSLCNPRYIINFPTKDHWKAKSKIEDIESGIHTLVREVVTRGIKTIAIPPLGCGLGGLDWNRVRPIIEKAFEPLSGVLVYLYEPVGAPVSKAMVKGQVIPSITTPRAALLGLMRQYLAAVMDPSITLLEIHKLLYFMQEAGEPLNLNYAKAPYGPYAANLRHLLNHLEGHFISGYGDGEDKPDVQIELLPPAYEVIDKHLADNNETYKNFKRVSSLIEGFETPYGMELLSTVHWVATRENAKTQEDIVEHVYAWGDHKNKFPQAHIRIARDVLFNNSWIE
jgi:O-acetyl-ADP-ribose deacetylase (regulator of RNase III)